MKKNRKQRIKEITSQLDKIQEYFTTEDIDLDEALEKYEEAIRLTKELEKLLENYKNKLKNLKSKQNETL